MRVIYFSRQRTYEGFTYLPGVKYLVAEFLESKLTATFPKVTSVDKPAVDDLIEGSQAEKSKSSGGEVMSTRDRVSPPPKVVSESVVEVEKVEPVANVKIREELETDAKNSSSVDDLNIPDRAKYLLSAAGFTSKTQIDKASDEKLLAISGIGLTYLAEIREAVA